MPNTHTILEDFGLIGTTEQDWKDLWKGLEKIPKKGWRIWEDKGFSFTFVSRELHLLQRLEHVLKWRH